MTTTTQLFHFTEPHDPEPIHTLEYITPARAAYLLTLNTGNRPLSVSRVRQMVRDMQAGNWLYNGKSILVSATNVLLDGQHRLTAVVESGVTIRSIVITGMPDDVMPTIDTNAQGRTTAQALVIAARTNPGTMDGIRNPTQQAAVARLVMAYEAGQVGTHGFHATVTEMLTWLGNNDLTDTIAVVNAVKVSKIPASSTVIGAAYYICRSIDPDAAHTFFVDQFVNMIGLTPHSPARALRSRLTSLDDNTTTGKANQLRFVFAAWNAFRDRRPVIRLQVPNGGWTARNTPFPY